MYRAGSLQVYTTFAAKMWLNFSPSDSAMNVSFRGREAFTAQCMYAYIRLYNVSWTSSVNRSGLAVSIHVLVMLSCGGRRHVEDSLVYFLRVEYTGCRRAPICESGNSSSWSVAVPSAYISLFFCKPVWRPVSSNFFTLRKDGTASDPIWNTTAIANLRSSMEKKYS